MHQIQLHEHHLLGAKNIFFTNLWFEGIQIVVLIFSITSSNKSLHSFHNLKYTSLQ